MNERARELLGLPAGLDGAGRPLVEVARQPQVSEMLRGLAGGETVLSRDLMLEGAERTTLQVNGARLCGPDGQPFGYVLVLHDVTELRRLEVVRRDFVANVSHELRTPLTAIKAYADRFRQVLINLVDNAIKYTPGGGRVFVRAAASGAEHDGMVEIAVEDTGVGIPARDLPRLTERFFRVDKGRSRALGGTGLGLAIVKHIVQAHGGELGITSAVGRGTTVRVLWPAAAPA